MSYQSVNPANGETVQTFNESTDQELEAALQTAATCFESWSCLTAPLTHGPPMKTKLKTNKHDHDLATFERLSQKTKDLMKRKDRDEKTSGPKRGGFSRNQPPTNDKS